MKNILSTTASPHLLSVTPLVCRLVTTKPGHRHGPCSPPASPLTTSMTHPSTCHAATLRHYCHAFHTPTSVRLALSLGPPSPPEVTPIGTTPSATSHRRPATTKLGHRHSLPCPSLCSQHVSPQPAMPPLFATTATPFTHPPACALPSASARRHPLG